MSKPRVVVTYNKVTAHKYARNGAKAALRKLVLQFIVATVTVMPVTMTEIEQVQPVTKRFICLKVHLEQLFTLFGPAANTLYWVKVTVRVKEFSEATT